MVYRNINFIKVFMDNLFLLFERIVEGNELILELLYNFDIFKVLFKQVKLKKIFVVKFLLLVDFIFFCKN